MPYLRAPTYRVIRVIDSAGRWRPDFEGKKSCSREMEMDELEPAMEDVGMGWSRVTEQDGAVYYWHEASEQSRWEPPPHSTPNGCGGARLGHRMCEGCGAKQAKSLAQNEPFPSCHTRDRRRLELLVCSCVLAGDVLSA